MYLYRTVSENNSVSNNDVTLKCGLGVIQGHWKWHHSIDCIRVSYWLSIVTMTLSCIISKIRRANWKKSRFFTSHMHSTPSLWGSPSEYYHKVWCRKTRMASLPDVENMHFKDMFARFDTIQACDGQTDRRQTNWTVHN